MPISPLLAPEHPMTCQMTLKAQCLTFFAQFGAPPRDARGRGRKASTLRTARDAARTLASFSAICVAVLQSVPNDMWRFEQKQVALRSASASNSADRAWFAVAGRQNPECLCRKCRVDIHFTPDVRCRWSRS
jgi:hypothetical protein